MKPILHAFCVALAVLALAGCASPRVSILGDSYSTFQGWIPDGYANWYPASTHGQTNDVSAPEECWWHLVTTALHGTLEQNDSWSGSTICYTGYNGVDASAWSFIARADRLGTPTHILVCGATNDSWANVPIGEYKWADWTHEDLFAFRPGLAKLLADLKATYPKAKIYFILNSELSEPINESVHAVCGHYQVPCIDLHDIDKQVGHPSVAGMRAMAEQVLKAISGK